MKRDKATQARISLKQVLILIPTITMFLDKWAQLMLSTFKLIEKLEMRL